jgi:hypothetical protein
MLLFRPCLLARNLSRAGGTRDNEIGTLLEGSTRVAADLCVKAAKAQILSLRRSINDVETRGAFWYIVFCEWM